MRLPIRPQFKKHIAGEHAALVAQVPECDVWLCFDADQAYVLFRTDNSRMVMTMSVRRALAYAQEKHETESLYDRACTAFAQVAQQICC
jgi:hypothetical protein